MLSDLKPDTPLTRYEVDRKKIGKDPPPMFPKPKFFLPRMERSTGQLAFSTFRTDGMAEKEIWDLGQAEVGDKHTPSRDIKARSDLPVEVFEERGLNVIYDNDPPRHVNVLGWPESEDERLEVAQLLAADAAKTSGFHAHPDFD